MIFSVYTIPGLVDDSDDKPTVQGDAFHGLDHRLRLETVEARGRLVQKEHRGVGDQLHADIGPFPLSSRHAA